MDAHRHFSVRGRARRGHILLSSNTHTHTCTQSSTLVFDWGPFLSLKGGKVLDALIDSLTAGYSIFEFSAAVSTDARNPGSDQL